jgi:uracil-DNA glycosylase
VLHADVRAELALAKGALDVAARGHGQVYPLPDGRVIITSYHPSQQNTFTGKLTHVMFYRVFELAREHLTV